MRVAFSFTNHKKAKHPFGCFAFFRALRSARKRRALCASTLTLVAARRVLRAFCFAKRRAFYACRSSSRKIFALQIFFGIATDTKHAAQRYAIPSASPPYGLPGAAMIADEKAARQKTMKNNAFFMVFCYFDCEEEDSGSDFIVLKKLMLK